MKIVDIEKKAKSLGLKDTWKLSKKDLIKTIQRKEGNFDCFGNAINSCSQAVCCWRPDCLK